MRSWVPLLVLLGISACGSKSPPPSAPVGSAPARVSIPEPAATSSGSDAAGPSSSASPPPGEAADDGEGVGIICVGPCDSDDTPEPWARPSDIGSSDGGTNTGMDIAPAAPHKNRAYGTPKLKLGAVNVSGNLPPEIVKRIVRVNFGAFRICYEKALKDDPKVSGELIPSFKIETDGSVTHIGFGSSISETAGSGAAFELSACMADALADIVFPAGQSIVDVRVHITFSTEKP